MLHSFYCPLQESKFGMEMPKVPVVSRYFIAYLASFVAVAPFFQVKVAPFFRAKDKPQTGTVKFFDKALCKFAGMKDTALSAYLHSKATAWYKRFPPIHSPDRAKDPKTPKVDGGDGGPGGGRPRTRTMSRTRRVRVVSAISCTQMIGDSEPSQQVREYVPNNQSLARRACVCGERGDRSRLSELSRLK